MSDQGTCDIRSNMPHLQLRAVLAMWSNHKYNDFDELQQQLCRSTTAAVTHVSQTSAVDEKCQECSTRPTIWTTHKNYLVETQSAVLKLYRCEVCLVPTDGNFSSCTHLYQQKNVRFLPSLLKARVSQN